MSTFAFVLHFRGYSIPPVTRKIRLESGKAFRKCRREVETFPGPANADRCRHRCWPAAWHKDRQSAGHFIFNLQCDRTWSVSSSATASVSHSLLISLSLLFGLITWISFRRTRSAFNKVQCGFGNVSLRRVVNCWEHVRFYVDFRTQSPCLLCILFFWPHGQKLISNSHYVGPLAPKSTKYAIH